MSRDSNVRGKKRPTENTGKGVVVGLNCYTATLAVYRSMVQWKKKKRNWIEGRNFAKIGGEKAKKGEEI